MTKSERRYRQRREPSPFRRQIGPIAATLGLTGAFATVAAGVIDYWQTLWLNIAADLAGAAIILALFPLVDWAQRMMFGSRETLLGPGCYVVAENDHGTVEELLSARPALTASPDAGPLLTTHFRRRRRSRRRHQAAYAWRRRHTIHICGTTPARDS
ncbi:hypothetical protein BJY16_008851 [Actinoplanes octamycinicus]|uniref:Uncharacterized protein n=1 Tax=Actinoplanes octamycinicus TaxID=135948 RepID=A0A7W7H7R5_9ACTN|nr:hypothetical protein [Actinoplanes octamycinicus]MBB4745392.1 hypothetical protein [Actinoplanes octamycinicus]GIE56232.1 hypothetical protein Aoc01nite_16340 [Actinoplanes octamycinicus]